MQDANFVLKAVELPEVRDALRMYLKALSENPTTDPVKLSLVKDAEERATLLTDIIVHDHKLKKAKAALHKLTNSPAKIPKDKQEERITAENTTDRTLDQDIATA